MCLKHTIYAHTGLAVTERLLFDIELTRDKYTSTVTLGYGP